MTKKTTTADDQGMEKYGVSDVAKQQQEELKQVTNELIELKQAHEKTAAVAAKVEQLTERQAQLRKELNPPPKKQ